MNIGICGKAGTGKTAVADRLVKKYGYKRYAVADEVKKIAMRLFTMKEKDRKLLQDIGFKMREIRPSVWIDFLVDQIRGKDKIVVDDIRYPNEHEALKKEGFKMIRVVADREICIKRLTERDGTAAIERLDDESETAMDDVDIENILNGSLPLEKMFAQLDELLESLNTETPK
ncbi:AAA family ATPase [bacterium]|nr:AAA family ATPase [bacterium]